MSSFEDETPPDGSPLPMSTADVAYAGEEPPGISMPHDELGNEPINVGADILMALSAAAGGAGCLMWDVGPVFFFAPLGLAAAALLLFLTSLELCTRSKPIFTISASISIVIAGSIGFIT